MGSIRHRTTTSELAGGLVDAAQWDEDHDINLVVSDVTGLQTALDAKADDAALAASGGSDLVGFIQSGTGAVARTVQDKARDVVSVEDFGAVADSTTDCTVFIQTALNSGALYVTAKPVSGHYFRLTAPVSIPAGVTLDGNFARFKQTTAGDNGFTLGAGSRLLNAEIQGADTNGGTPLEECNGVYVSSANNWRVENCIIHDWEYCGIYARNCNNFVVQNNVIYANRDISNTAADILIWSTATARGGQIKGNYCFSNNSQGIYYSVAGFDIEGIISDNTIVTLDYATGALVSSGSLARRWGIIMGYGTAAKALICTGNTIRNTTAGGIYRQAGDVGVLGAGVIISANQIADTGINSVQPSLSSAITLAAQGSGDIVSFNRIENAQENNLGEAGAISIQPNPVGVEQPEGVSTLIFGNSISGSLAHGILVAFKARNVTLDSNKIQGCEKEPIYYVPTTARADIDFFVIRNNEIFHNFATSAIVYIFPPSSGNERIIIENNVMRGLNNTTVDANNCGILFNANADAAGLEIRNNRIYRCRMGIATSFYLTSNLTTIVDGNRIENCHTGIAAGVTSGEGGLFPSNTIYKNNTFNVGGGVLLGAERVFEVTYNNGKKEYYASAAPTTGTWAVGDRTVNIAPSVGQPKAWSCTVAGSPGTWVSEGNL